MTAARVTADAADRIVGRFAIATTIAAGGAGCVYEARDRETGQRLALKMLAPDMEQDAEARERFCREAAILARLSHPNIVRVLDVGEVDGRQYMAMELIDGLPLGEYLRAHPALPLEQRIELLVQIYQGLAAAHAQGVVHRDIKPGNILVQPNGAVKLLDFGLARLRHSTLTGLGRVVGSPVYMAPEQVEGRPVDERSDIFSAAAVGVLVLSGEPPFKAPNLPLLLHAILHDEPTIAEGAVPASVAQVLRTALAKTADARYQTCADVIAALQRAVTPGSAS